MTPDMTTDQPIDALQATVREKYGQAAQRVIDGEGIPADCCGKTGCCT